MNQRDPQAIIDELFDFHQAAMKKIRRLERERNHAEDVVARLYEDHPTFHADADLVLSRKAKRRSRKRPV